MPEQAIRRCCGDVDLAAIVGNDVDAFTLPVPLRALVSSHFMQTTMSSGRGVAAAAKAAALRLRPR